jgi:hypothetical protein
MTAAQQCKAQRVVHLAAALVLVGYLYAPSKHSSKTPSASSFSQCWS